MPLMLYEQPLLTIVQAVKHVKAKGCECRKTAPRPARNQLTGSAEYQHFDIGATEVGQHPHQAATTSRAWRTFRLGVWIRDTGSGFNGLLGTPELAFGGDGHSGREQRDHAAEDKESCRVRRRHDIAGELLIEASKLASKIATSSTLNDVTF